MKRSFIVFILLISMTASILCTSACGYQQPTEVTADDAEICTEASIFSWYLHLFNEGAVDVLRPMLEELNITRIYQSIPEAYLTDMSVHNTIKRLADENIEIVALAGEKAWGLPGADLSGIYHYIDAIKAYNEEIGTEAQIRKLALDVETYTTNEWKSDRIASFSAYINNMQAIYLYANAAGLEVIQIIPVFYDTIDENLFRYFLKTCCDEVALMNYTKSSQISAIRHEVELCRELGMRLETIFETKPVSEQYSVTDKNTYFYDGIPAMTAARDNILKTYRYSNLSVSYHHLTTMYHLYTGKYLAEIYVYTDKNDPTRDKLGQTTALSTITLTAEDGSSVTGHLYNPNLEAEYPEVCYLVFGIEPDRVYTVSDETSTYEILTPELIFTYETGKFVDYTSIKMQRSAAVTETEQANTPDPEPSSPETPAPPESDPGEPPKNTLPENAEQNDDTPSNDCTDPSVRRDRPRHRHGKH